MTGRPQPTETVTGRWDENPPTHPEYVDRKRAALDVQDTTMGRWIAWYGMFTESYWATPRPPCPWLGLVEAKTPLGLCERIAEVDAYYGPFCELTRTRRTNNGTRRLER